MKVYIHRMFWLSCYVSISCSNYLYLHLICTTFIDFIHFIDWFFFGSLGEYILQEDVDLQQPLLDCQQVALPAELARENRDYLPDQTLGFVNSESDEFDEVSIFFLSKVTF